MSTTSRRHTRATRTSRTQTGIHPQARSRARAERAPEEPVAIPVMGPANHAPGAPIMGLPGRGPHPVMGGSDAGPRVSVMGAGDSGTRIGLFGVSDSRSVDSLFAPRSR